jgi:GT2 family glycosyltransferase
MERLAREMNRLSSLGENAYDQDVSFLILDNGSTDGTFDMLTQMYGNYWSKVTLVRSDTNTGIIEGHQIQVDWLIAHGLKRDDIVVFLDDDVTPLENGWLYNLIAPILLDPKTVAVTGCYAAMLQPDWSGYLLPNPETPGPVHVVNQSHTAVAAHLFLDGFRFDKKLGRVWHEDLDLCSYARAHGYVVFFVGTAISIGLMHDNHHKTTDADYFKNFEYVRSKWQGIIG